MTPFLLKFISSANTNRHYDKYNEPNFISNLKKSKDRFALVLKKHMN